MPTPTPIFAFAFAFTFTFTYLHLHLAYILKAERSGHRPIEFVKNITFWEKCPLTVTGQNGTGQNGSGQNGMDKMV